MKSILYIFAMLCLNISVQADFDKTVNHKGYSPGFQRINRVFIDVDDNTTRVILNVYKNKAAFTANKKDYLLSKAIILEGTHFKTRANLRTAIKEHPDYTDAVENP